MNWEYIIAGISGAIAYVISGWFIDKKATDIFGDEKCLSTNSFISCISWHLTPRMTCTYRPELQCFELKAERSDKRVSIVFIKDSDISHYSTTKHVGGDEGRLVYWIWIKNIAIEIDKGFFNTEAKSEEDI